MDALKQLLQDILLQLNYLPRALILLVPLCMAWLFVEDNRGRVLARLRVLLRRGWVIAFILYAALLLTSTVLGRTTIRPYASVFKNFFLRSDPAWNNEIYENILLFIPYGFLLLQAVRPSRPLRCALTVSLLTTVLIELTQLLLWLGEFQLSDIVHNTLGGLIGYVIWRFVRLFSKKHE